MGKIIAGFLVGENSRKREIGLFMGALIMIAEAAGWITPELATELIKVTGLWLGMAYSAKLSKVHKALREASNR